MEGLLIKLPKFIEYSKIIRSSNHNLEQQMRNHISKFSFSNQKFFDMKKSKIIPNFNPTNIIDDFLEKKYGMCMELNYFFGTLLIDKGYNVRFVKCFKPHNDSFFDIWHMALIVDDHFVDVGFGEYFRKPIKLLVTCSFE